MKKLIITICFLIAAVVTAWSQKIPIMGPIQVYGSITPVKMGVFPADPDSLEIININDSLWIYDSGAWNLFYPTGYIDNDTLRFNDGSFITSNFGSVRIHPAGGHLSLFISRPFSIPNIQTGSLSFLVGLDTLQGFNGSLAYRSVDMDQRLYFFTTAAGRWRPLAYADEQSGGEVDTLGIPTSNRLTYFSAPNKIGSLNNFAVGATSLTIDYLAYKSNLTNQQLAFLQGGTNDYTHIKPFESNGSTALAHYFNTYNAFTGNAKIMTVRTANVEKFYIKSDTTAVNNSLVVRDSVFLKKLPPNKLLKLSPTGAITTTDGTTGAVSTSSATMIIKESILTAADTSGYIYIAPNHPFTGKNLAQLTATFYNKSGAGTVTVDAYRLRSGTEVKMTSTAASFTGTASPTNATINASNDDIAVGDRIRFITTASGSMPVGAQVTVICQEP